MAATWSVTDYQYNVTSRPYMESCQVKWPRGESGGQLQASETPSASADRRTTTTSLRDFYVVHPDWTSEALCAQPPPAPSDQRLARRPWLWEEPRARERFYPDKQSQLRSRVLRDMQAEDRVKRLHTDPHYQVRHNSPWYINNPAEVRDSNPLEKRQPLPDLYHLRPWNNARRVLARELANPVLPEVRASSQSAALSLVANDGPTRTSGGVDCRPMTADEVAQFRCRSGQYMTSCDWN